MTKKTTHKLNNLKRGNQLEEIVESLLKKKKLKVKRNIILEKKKYYSQIDLSYGLISKRYIECKEYYKKNVSLKDISKFYAVLKLNNINPSKGEFYTNSNYCYRAREFAKMYKIKLYDYKYLKEQLNKHKLKKELTKLQKLSQK